MKRKWIIPCVVAIFVIAILFYSNIQKDHTIKIEDRGNLLSL